MNAHKQSKNIKNILFFFVFFSFVKSKFDEINLEKNDFSKTYLDQKEALQFKIKGNPSPYIKITVEGKDGKINNHIISYYQKDDLKERKQLSQSIKDTTIMWLSKEQIKNDFYITVESSKACSFEIKINKKDKAELYLNEQYTYYVTDGNKEMDFILKDSTKEYDKTQKYFVSLWVRGNYKIETKMSGKEKKYSSNTYSYYQVEYDDNFINSKVTLNIKGEIGDLINVGLIFFSECVDNHCVAQLKLENGEEVSGYLPNGLGHIFPYNSLDNDQLSLGNCYDFNNKHMSSPIFSISKFSNERSYNVESKNEDIFYVLQHIDSTLYDEQGNNKYLPLINGIYYSKYINQGTAISLIPMKPEDDFNFITYEVIPDYGDIDVSIYECDNYPLCHINNGISNSKNIGVYRNYYYTTYTKKEWGEDITPISKKQHMLIITCRNGIKNMFIDKLCSVNINMKTDKKVLNYTDFTLTQPPYQRYIRKNNEDKYFLRRSDNPIHLYIEKITGDFSIEINGKDNNYKKYSKENKYFFLIPENIDVNIKIKAKDNSFYSINANFNNKIEYFSIGYNYLLNVENEIELNPGVYDEDEDEDEDEEEEFYNNTLYKNEKEYKYIINRFSNDNLYNLYNQDNSLDYFIAIYSLNCEINVKLMLDNKVNEDKNINKDNFYQNILTELKDYKFKIKKVKSDKSSENCLFYITSYFKNYDNYNNYITLLNGVSHISVFNRYNNFMNFSFPLTNIDNDIKIEFKLLDKGKYKSKIKINGEIIENDIDESKDIKLKADDIKKGCEVFKFQCYILLDIITKDTQKESKLKITLTSEEDDDDDNKPIVILIILAVVIIGVIVGLIIYIIKTIKKNEGLNKAVNQISFKEDRDNDNEAIIDTLLD